jgi:hypothetical protein
MAYVLYLVEKGGRSLPRPVILFDLRRRTFGYRQPLARLPAASAVDLGVRSDIDRPSEGADDPVAASHLAPSVSAPIAD